MAEKSIGIGTIVKVTVAHPDGSIENTEGNIGVVSEIESFVTTDELDYTVHTMDSDYVYGIDQIREATPEEISYELYRLLLLTR